MFGLGTPERNHLRFPKREGKNDHEVLSIKTQVTLKRKRFSENLSMNMSRLKLHNQVEIAHDVAGDGNYVKQVEERSSEQDCDIFKIPVITDEKRKRIRNNIKEFFKKVQKPSQNIENLCGRKNSSLAGCPINSSLQRVSGSEIKTSSWNKLNMNRVSELHPAVDAQMEKR